MMKSYDLTGASREYGFWELVADLIEGILISEEESLDEEVCLFQVPPWLANIVAESLVKRGVCKREGVGGRFRLYVKTPREGES
tara:strand:+ start:179 stop:430 length:252 start_codon:yes stop_codon:yes gene_type:complete